MAKKRRLSSYNICMRRELKKKRMKGKSKAQRIAIFRAAARKCS